jgi:hypothetical protein
MKTSYEVPYKTGLRQQCKKCEACSINYVNEQSNVLKICSGVYALPHQAANIRRISEHPAEAFFEPNTAGKGHTAVGDGSDTKHQFESSSRDCHLANPIALADSSLSDTEQGLSHYLIAVDTSASQDTSKEIYHFATGKQSSSSYSAAPNHMESFRAPFLDNQITPGPEDKFVCEQSEADINLIQEHAELLMQQQANTSCDTVRFSCDGNQYWLENDQEGSETTELLCSVMEPTKRTGIVFTGSNTENEDLPDVRSHANDSSVEDDKIQIVDTSSDTMSGCPLTPGTDYSCEDQLSVVSGDVRGGADLHLRAEKAIGDLSSTKAVPSESQWGRHEEEQEQQTADQECPVWKILKKSECPFQWLPDVINSVPCSTVQENMITYLTGKPMNIIQA